MLVALRALQFDAMMFLQLKVLEWFSQFGGSHANHEPLRRGRKKRDLFTGMRALASSLGYNEAIVLLVVSAIRAVASGNRSVD